MAAVKPFVEVLGLLDGERLLMARSSADAFTITDHSSATLNSFEPRWLGFLKTVFIDQSLATEIDEEALATAIPDETLTTEALPIL
jgi:hypothetical protein